jgi:hypothetical protein
VGLFCSLTLSFNSNEIDNLPMYLAKPPNELRIDAAEGV